MCNEHFDIGCPNNAAQITQLYNNFDDNYIQPKQKIQVYKFNDESSSQSDEASPSEISNTSSSQHKKKIVPIREKKQPVSEAEDSAPCVIPERQYETTNSKYVSPCD